MPDPEEAGPRCGHPGRRNRSISRSATCLSSSPKRLCNSSRITSSTLHNKRTRGSKAASSSNPASRACRSRSTVSASALRSAASPATPIPPINDQPHSTRYVDLFDWEDGDMIDDQDKIRMLTDPQSDYVAAMVASLNRAKDDVIVSAPGGNSRSSTGNIILPAGQKIAVGGAGLTKAKMIQARKLFRQNEADAEAGEELFMAYASSQLSDLLTDTSLTNTEVNTVLSLMDGTLKNASLMGFKMVPLERLQKASTTRYCYAWAKSGVTLGVGETS